MRLRLLKKLHLAGAHAIRDSHHIHTRMGSCWNREHRAAHHPYCVSSCVVLQSEFWYAHSTVSIPEPLTIHARKQNRGGPSVIGGSSPPRTSIVVCCGAWTPLDILVWQCSTNQTKLKVSQSMLQCDLHKLIWQ